MRKNSSLSAALMMAALAEPIIHDSYPAGNRCRYRDTKRAASNAARKRKRTLQKQARRARR